MTAPSLMKRSPGIKIIADLKSTVGGVRDWTDTNWAARDSGDALKLLLSEQGTTSSAAVRATWHVDELPLCDARSMTDKPRYQLRANSAALSRFQWWIVGMAFFVAAVGAVLALAGSAPFGTMMMSLSALTGIFTVVSANGRGPSK
jgi:hypothetical protein